MSESVWEVVNERRQRSNNAAAAANGRVMRGGEGKRAREQESKRGGGASCGSAVLVGPSSLSRRLLCLLPLSGTGATSALGGSYRSPNLPATPHPARTLTHSRYCTRTSWRLAVGFSGWLLLG